MLAEVEEDLGLPVLRLGDDGHDGHDVPDHHIGLAASAELGPDLTEGPGHA